MTAPTWRAYGTPGTSLRPFHGRLRTAFNGDHGAHGVYHRYATDNVYTPPFTFSGRMYVFERQQPYRFEWGGTPGYQPGIVFHPLHIHNDLNAVIRFGSLDQDKFAASAEYEGGYGFRSGFERRERMPSFDPVGDGWFNFAVEVLAHHHWRLSIDGEVVCEIIEKQPQTIPAGPVGVGLRLDFFDVALDDLDVTEHRQEGDVHRLTRLADHLRAAGLPVIEVPGWQDRGRGGDGGRYSTNRPTHVMVHHTASNTTAASDVAYMAHNSPIAPIANLYVARGGAVHVIAAGPANTNGRGSAPWAPFVADNDMNRHAIGVELGNAGTGEPYPEAQQLAAVEVAAALCRSYGIDTRYVRAHHEWAPRRKIDPAGPSQWAPDGGLWNMDSFRTSVANRLAATITTPDPEEDDMPAPLLWRDPRYKNVFDLTGGILSTTGEVMKQIENRHPGIKIAEDEHDQTLAVMCHHAYGAPMDEGDLAAIAWAQAKGFLVPR